MMSDDMPLAWATQAPCVMAPPHLKDWAERAGSYLKHKGLADCVAFATSGSSGSLPKAIVFTRSALDVCARGAVEHLQAYRGDWCCPLPVWHVGGAMIHLRAAIAGTRVYTLKNKWNPAAYAQLMGESGAEFSSLVPTQVIDLVTEHLQAPPAVRCIIVGGGALNEATGKRARELGWPVVQSYGMTESGSQLATALPQEPYHVNELTVLPHWQVKTNAMGQLQFHGKGMPCARLLTRDNGDFTLEHHAPDQWWTGSDKVELTNRKITFLRRSDRLIKILGELIDPDAIQAGICRIAPGTVIESIPHTRAGLQLVACGPDEQAMRRACLTWNATAPGPQRVHLMLVTAIPLTIMGKQDKTALRAKLVNGAFIDIKR